MFARRLSALFLALFTLHLNLLGADFACAKHGAAGAEMNMQMESHDSSRSAVVSHEHVMPATNEMVAVSISDNGAEHPPCDVPAQASCCKALTSCSVVFSSEKELQVASAPNFREMIALGRMTAPPSELAAPEPPPPKA